MNKLSILILLATIFIFKSCETCSVSFSCDGSSNCSSLSKHNIKYDAYGNIVSFDYSGCGETGHVVISYDENHRCNGVDRECD